MEVVSAASVYPLAKNRQEGDRRRGNFFRSLPESRYATFRVNTFVPTPCQNRHEMEKEGEKRTMRNTHEFIIVTRAESAF